MKLFFGTDHGGFLLKEYLRNWVSQLPEFAGALIEDCGAVTLDPDDSYVPYAQKVARFVQRNAGEPESEQQTFGILLCRSGGGMCIAANRFERVRAVVCRNRGDALHARGHNNANILVLEGDHVSPVQAEEIVRMFLRTPFDEGRHLGRVRSIEERKEA